jgi:hypothetical protein
MNSNTKITKILIAAAVAFLFCSSAQGGTVYTVPGAYADSDVNVLLSATYPPSGPPIYALLPASGACVNALPTPCNNAYNATESGLTLGALLGGDVTNTTATAWGVGSLSVWAVGYTPVTATQVPPFPFEWSTPLTLIGGAYVDNTSIMSAVATTSTGVYTPFVGTLDGSKNYASSGSPGTYYAVWQLTFNTSGLVILPGEDYVFGVSTGGADNLQLLGTSCPSGVCISSGDVKLDPIVPEPTTWMLFGVGIGVLGLVRRRRG